MKIELSTRVKKIKPSLTFAVTFRAAELRAEGKDVIGLGAGEPDFDTPEFIKQAAIKAINDGFTKYTAVPGTPSLRKAVADKFQRDNGLSYKPEQVLISCGGKQSFFNLAQALLSSGDEVIIPAPYWVSYPDMVLLADGKPVIVQASVDQNFKITPQQLENAITARTRLFIINSPSNPTGVAYTRAELEQLGDILRKHPQVVIATDDMYEHIVWGSEPFSNILMACPDLYERTMVLNGVSKAYAMTGWRIGYCAGPLDLIKAMSNVQGQSTSNPASISQMAAQAALEGDQSCISDMVKAFKERHDFVYQAFRSLEGVDVVPADGTFYSFPSFQKVIDRLDGIGDDLAFAEHLLNECGVAVVPGSAFGSPGCIRVSFATSMENLKNAMARITKLLA